MSSAFNVALSAPFNHADQSIPIAATQSTPHSNFTPLGLAVNRNISRQRCFYKLNINKSREGISKFVLFASRNPAAEADKDFCDIPETAPSIRIDNYNHVAHNSGISRHPLASNDEIELHIRSEASPGMPKGSKEHEIATNGIIHAKLDASTKPSLEEIEFRDKIVERAEENVTTSTSSSPGNEVSGISKEAAVGGSLLAAAGVAAVVAVIGGVGYVYKDQINDFLIVFESQVQELGVFGYPLFVLGYAGLEILAVPAIPITMSAGLLFGPITGTILCSAAGTLSAVISFLIARYIARDRIMKMAGGNKKFAAIDKAIGEDSFRIVTLLRLSPLLPFSLGNYIYGLTSVQLVPYIFGSWLGMLPGTWAYVSAGVFGRSLIKAEEGNLFSGETQLWALGAGILFTLGAGSYVANVAKKAVEDLDCGED